MVDLATMPMFLEVDAPAIIVWILRLVVPCILFWISFGPRINLQWPWTGPSYSKEVLLRHRKAVHKEDNPCEALATLTMVDEQTAPALFQDKSKKERETRRESRKERDEDGDEKRQSRDDRRGRKDRSQIDSTAEDPAAENDRKERERLRKAEEAEEARKAGAREKQMHFESLVNFVAFNKYKQQRVFLFDEDSKPPPPPQRSPNAKPLDGPKEAQCLTMAAAERANVEAQMVLNGALSMQSTRVSVTDGLYHQLTEMNVEVSPSTFELMVEACIQAKDLPAASDFLMRMEGCGHAPGNHILDHVMELYLHHKKEDGTSAKADALAAATSALPLLGQSLIPGASSSASAPYSNGDGSRLRNGYRDGEEGDGSRRRNGYRDGEGNTQAAAPHVVPPPAHRPGSVQPHQPIVVPPPGTHLPPMAPMGQPPPPPPQHAPAIGVPHAGVPMGGMSTASGMGATMHHIGHSGAMNSQVGAYWHEDHGGGSVSTVRPGGMGSNAFRDHGGGSVSTVRPGGMGSNAFRVPRDADPDLPAFSIPDEFSRKKPEDAEGKAGATLGDEAATSFGFRAEAAEFVPGEAPAIGSTWKPSAHAEEFKPSEFRATAAPFVPGESNMTDGSNGLDSRPSGEADAGDDELQ